MHWGKFSISPALTSKNLILFIIVRFNAGAASHFLLLSLHLHTEQQCAKTAHKSARVAPCAEGARAGRLA